MKSQFNFFLTTCLFVDSEFISKKVQFITKQPLFWDDVFTIVEATMLSQDDC